LRAIRERLQTMGLDWDWSEFSASSAAGNSLAKNNRPLRVEVVGAQQSAMSATNAAPARP
jgi:hypothetical protein